MTELNESQIKRLKEMFGGQAVVLVDQITGITTLVITPKAAPVDGVGGTIPFPLTTKQSRIVVDMLSGSNVESAIKDTLTGQISIIVLPKKTTETVIAEVIQDLKLVEQE